MAMLKNMGIGVVLSSCPLELRERKLGEITNLERPLSPELRFRPLDDGEVW